MGPDVEEHLPIAQGVELALALGLGGVLRDRLEQVGAVLQLAREALAAFGKQIKGFDMEDAVLTGVETRTSSPVRIARGEDLQSPNVQGLYPGGEGAGYAGGILSAAVDGIKLAEAVAKSIVASTR